MSRIYDALAKAREDSRSLRVVDVEPPVTHRSDLKDLVVINEPDSSLAESFRFLRAQMLRPTIGTAPRSILITSAIPGEGKTFVAANLAACVSQTPERHVLLMDSDLRLPSIHKVFGLNGRREGLSNFLTSDVPLAPLIQSSFLDRLSILTAGSFRAIPGEILSSRKMRDLMGELNNQSPDQLVIVDSPPLELTPESSLLAQDVDAVLIVVRNGFTSRSQVLKALGRIRREKLIGVVYNGYDQSRRTYDRYKLYEQGYGRKGR